MPRALPLTVRLHQPGCAGVRSGSADRDTGNDAEAGCQKPQVGRDGGHRARQCGATTGRKAPQQRPSSSKAARAPRVCARSTADPLSTAAGSPAPHTRDALAAHTHCPHAQRACIALHSAGTSPQRTDSHAPGVTLRQQLVKVVQVHEIVELPGGTCISQLHTTYLPLHSPFTLCRCSVAPQRLPSRRQI